jgi:hypothetical protein
MKDHSGDGRHAGMSLNPPGGARHVTLRWPGMATIATVSLRSFINAYGKLGET